jgi:hypothetical protein
MSPIKWNGGQRRLDGSAGHFLVGPLRLIFQFPSMGNRGKLLVVDPFPARQDRKAARLCQ